MLLYLLMVVFGITALIKGEFKITNKRKVTRSKATLLGILLILGAVLGFFVYGYAGIFTLILVIIIGLATSEKIESQDVTTPK
jgi:uncharacterized membrane protein HdeD (DUF308 family)